MFLPQLCADFRLESAYYFITDFFNECEKVIKNVIRITLVQSMHIMQCINNILVMVNKYITVISMYLLLMQINII